MKYIVYNYISKAQTVFDVQNPLTGKLAEAFDLFHHYYRPDLIVPPTSKRPALKRKAERVCRFCKLGQPDATFRKLAHVLPQLIGNRYLIHDSECDNCNSLFGRYEDSLSKYLGMIRTADAIKGQGGIPNYKSLDEKISMRYEREGNGKEWITIYDGRDNVNHDGKSILLTSTKQPYIPLHVMKCFYKIGYTLLSPHELIHYQSLLKIITSSEHDSLLGNLAFAIRYTLPAPVQQPFALTYIKKDQHVNEHIPTKVVVLYFGRYVFEYFLINSSDWFMFKTGEHCRFYTVPPITETPERITGTKIDLSSCEKKVGELDSGIFTFNMR